MYKITKIDQKVEKWTNSW